MRQRMSSLQLFGIGVACILACVLLFKTVGPTQISEQPGITIGILQTASHPALDAAREGFIAYMKSELGDKVNFIIQNAQADIAQAHMIAKSFHSNKKVKGIFAIATPAAQAIAHVEKEKPIFIAAVTDPAALGLLGPDSNVCGSTDMIEIPKQLELITSLVHQAKRIGIVFCLSEINAVGQAQQMKQALQNKNLIPVELAIANQADMPAIAQRIKDVDLLWAPTDNVIATMVTFLADKARALQKPFLVSDNLLVKDGALAAAGVDYHVSGQQAAACALEVLKHNKLPSALALAKPEHNTIVINGPVAEQLGIHIPEHIAKKRKAHD